jgi:hypothetical protein
MELKVIKTNFPDGFKESLKKARYKGVTALLDDIKGYIAITCYMNNRAVGRFLFEIQGDKCIVKKRLIIESEFYPLEIALTELLIYCKKKKIKSIEY